jgi:RNA polymerase sporulation-specific sigma factor
VITDEQLAARAAAGDELALRQLLDRFAPMTRKLANVFFAAGMERQDWDQEACIALHQAACMFDPSAGVLFKSWADLIVRRRLVDAVKTARRAKHLLLSDALSFEMTVGEDDGQDVTFGATLRELRPCEPSEVLQLRAELEALVRVVREDLSPLERDALLGQAAGETMLATQQRLGRAMPGTWHDGRPRPKTVENAIERAKRKIRAGLAEADAVPLDRAA